MASQVYNKAKQLWMQAQLDMDGHDIRVALLSTNTTADTENDGLEFVGDITTLDEFDGSGYSRAALANKAVNLDDANDRAEFDADDVDFGLVSAGTRSIAGVLIYRHVTNDADSPVIAWLEFASVKTPDGSNFTVQIDAEGLIHIT